MRYAIKLMTSMAVLGAMLLATGCSKPATVTPKTDDSAAKSGGAAEDHSHGAGPHGGTIADWGGGKYHVEFVVNHDAQQATVYVLADDAKTPVAIKANDGQLQLTIVAPPTQVRLAAQPQATDAAGASSRFVGKHENLGKVQEFAGTIVGEVDGTPYTGDFKEEPAGHTHP